MAMLFATAIVNEEKTFADVPRLLKPQVAKILVQDMNLPELVPVEFGGAKV